VWFAYLGSHRDEFDVAAMCKVFGVTLAGFYTRLTRPRRARANRADALVAQIKVVHREVKGV
jgi:hypothetical protein